MLQKISQKLDELTKYLEKNPNVKKGQEIEEALHQCFSHHRKEDFIRFFKLIYGRPGRFNICQLNFRMGIIVTYISLSLLISFLLNSWTTKKFNIVVFLVTLGIFLFCVMFLVGVWLKITYIDEEPINVLNVQFNRLKKPQPESTEKKDQNIVFKEKEEDPKDK